ncbi:hypothetical protein [Leptospira noguchii]|uniref:Uncharacterized protein n=1 Tax=Leptospira noguchii str. 2001034031 TaxID=1193053 RepID=M6YCT6_9LEPT|nr:hypothetical protein [Leptospira noguchii]EMO91560.1 hypothetical protein LEP1GSC024_2612 [Leptospira noguchii str. 2001034031]
MVAKKKTKKKSAKVAKKKAVPKKVARKRQIPKANTVKSTSKGVTVDVTPEMEGGNKDGQS